MTEFFNILKRLWKAYGLIILLGGALLLVGLGLLGWGGFSIYRAVSSQWWPIAQGKIDESYLQSWVENDDEGSTVMYGANIRYTYTVGGLNYSGSRVSMFDLSSSNSDHMRRILSRFPAGSIVEVHYDPSDPGEAVLEPGFRGGMIFPFAIGAVLCLFGWLISRWIIGDLLAGGLFSAPG